MGLKIIHISDTHNKHKQIKWTFDPSNADILIHSGDMSAMGRESEVTSFLKWFSGVPVKYKILIAGNHDLCFDPDRTEQRGQNMWVDGFMPEWLYDSLSKYFKAGDGLNYYLENGGCTIEGVNFWGSPITPTFGHGWGFNKNRGLDIGETWSKIPRSTDVLITHGPSYGFVDWGEQANGPLGCEQLRRAIKDIKPLLHLSGHIHEGYGYAYDADTHYFNGSICNLHGYVPENAPWCIEADFKEREIKILNYGSDAEETVQSESKKGEEE